MYYILMKSSWCHKAVTFKLIFLGKWWRWLCGGEVQQRARGGRQWMLAQDQSWFHVSICATESSSLIFPHITTSWVSWVVDHQAKTRTAIVNMLHLPSSGPPPSLHHQLVLCPGVCAGHLKFRVPLGVRGQLHVCHYRPRSPRTILPQCYQGPDPLPTFALLWQILITFVNIVDC